MTLCQPALHPLAPSPSSVTPRPALCCAELQVLKAHGHLLPPELEARANEQREEDRAAAERQRAAALEAGAQVMVQAAQRPSAALKLERSRSQQLRSALDQPAARAALRKAATVAAEARVLSAHSVLLAAAQQAGCSLAELAALPRQTMETMLPEGATLDVEQVIQDAAWATETLAALEDHSGWMTSRSDALQVHYRHQRGTTVHRCAWWRRAGRMMGVGAGQLVQRREDCMAVTAKGCMVGASGGHLIRGFCYRAKSLKERFASAMLKDVVYTSSSCSLKFAAVFEHPLEHLLALAHEFDLIVTWNK